MPRCTSSSHFSSFRDSGTFRARYKRSPHFSRSIDDRTTIDEQQFVPTRTSLSPTANLIPITSSRNSQQSAPSCPFLETRSLSIPTSRLLLLFHLQSFYPTNISLYDLICLILYIIQLYSN